MLCSFKTNCAGPGDYLAWRASYIGTDVVTELTVWAFVLESLPTASSLLYNGACSEAEMFCLTSLILATSFYSDRLDW